MKGFKVLGLGFKDLGFKGLGFRVWKLTKCLGLGIGVTVGKHALRQNNPNSRSCGPKPQDVRLRLHSCIKTKGPQNT